MSLSMVLPGRTGTTIPELALETWRFGRQNDDDAVEVGHDRAHELLDAYAVAGENFIDTADMYGDSASEICIGKRLGECDREEFTVAFKVF